jgi:hypothetical protein
MEPIVGGFLIIFVGLSYLKYMISRHCMNRNQNYTQQNIAIIQQPDSEIPPKYEDIPPRYSDV